MPDGLKQFIQLRILHTEDSTHKIALGVALGLLIAWTPTLGIHIYLALALTFLFRANKFAALICIWVSNPLTIIAIFYPSYLVGNYVLKYFNPEAQLTNTQIKEIFNQFRSMPVLTQFFQIEFWKNIFLFLWQRGPALWMGSIVIGTIVATAGYFTTYYLVLWYRKKHAKHLL